jgi:UDP-glucose 4-epimerase
MSVDVKGARNEVFNIGADVPFTVNVLADVVSQAMGVPCRKVHLPPRNEVKVAYADHAKAHRVFRPKQFMDLEEGIRRMAAWVKVHGARESSVFSAVEVPRNMPPTWASALRGAGAKA